MNRRRVAALFRELAAEFDSPEEQDHDASAEKSAATGRAPRSSVEKPAVERPLTDLEKARARKALRRLGLPA